jgi:hypothetical protein
LGPDPDKKKIHSGPHLREQDPQHLEYYKEGAFVSLFGLQFKFRLRLDSVPEPWTYVSEPRPSHTPAEPTRTRNPARPQCLQTQYISTSLHKKKLDHEKKIQWWSRKRRCLSLFLVLRGEEAECDGRAAAHRGGHVQHPVDQHLLLAPSLPVRLLNVRSQ